MQNNIHREFYKEKEKSKIWRVEEYTIADDGIIEPEKGLLLFSFDKVNVFNLWTDYPDKFTKGEKEIFDKEYPFWADFLKDR